MRKERGGLKVREKGGKKVVENFEFDNRIQLYSFLFPERELQGMRVRNKQGMTGESKREGYGCIDMVQHLTLKCSQPRHSTTMMQCCLYACNKPAGGFVLQS